MRDIYFNISLADTYTWMKPSSKPCDYEYYEYVTILVDYDTEIRNDTGNVIRGLEVTYVLQLIKLLCGNYVFHIGAYTGTILHSAIMSWV